MCVRRCPAAVAHARPLLLHLHVRCCWAASVAAPAACYLLHFRDHQERHTEKIFYGLNDIKDANDIIIVEGEMDKLAMEEAGFRNCVSVPDGAPSSISNEELPLVEQVIARLSQIYPKGHGSSSWWS